MPIEEAQDAIVRRSLLIAEPLALVREGFASLCESRAACEVVALCPNGEDALKHLRRLEPDLALLDQKLDRLFTLQLIRRARAVRLSTRMIVMGVRTDRKTVYETLRAGASGYVLKSGPVSELSDAFDQVLDGSVYISPQLDLQQIFVATKKPETDDPLERLSSREYEVFTLLIEGVRAKEIAARLELSPKTVDTYRASMMRKLDIHDIAGLVKFAIQNQIITTE